VTVELNGPDTRLNGVRNVTSKKGRSAGAQKRAQEKAKDMTKTAKRRKLEKERADAQRKKTAELLRSGKLKLKKAKPQTGLFALSSSLRHQPAIRRIDVVTDEHTTLKKVPNQYRLEGDTGW
jgi:hypothetical protein